MLIMDVEQLCHYASQKITFIDEYIHYLQLRVHHSKKETQEIFISKLFTM